MKLCLLLITLASSTLLSSCTNFYPLGHSRNGDYFGGQGISTAPNMYNPRDLQREPEIF
jgi:hypothetical protein